MIKFSITESTEDGKLKELFENEGVFLSDEKNPEREIVKCWIITHGEDKKVSGGAVLAKISGYYVVDGIAMAKEYQRIRLGKELMMQLIEQALISKAEAVYLTAVFPGFFEAIGFRQTEEGPEFLKEQCVQEDEEGRKRKLLKLQLQ